MKALGSVGCRQGSASSWANGLVKPSSGSQRGQALTEFIVLALALIPLYLLIPLIAKYQDISHASQMASRYVAFDAMVRNDGATSWKSRTQLEDEVRRRFFSTADAPIKTDDTAGNFKANKNPFWTDPHADPLIKDFKSDVRVKFGQGQADDHSNAFIPASDSSAFNLAPGVLGSLDLQGKGIFTSTVSVTLTNLSASKGSYTKSYDSLTDINLVLTRQTSLVIDPWASKGPQQTESRIDKVALFPGKAVAVVSPALDIAVVVVESPSCFSGGCTRAPRLGKLDLWSDMVPADRLK